MSMLFAPSTRGYTLDVGNGEHPLRISAIGTGSAVATHVSRPSERRHLL
jgi:hypothetical protein